MIRVRDLRREFGPVVALDRLDFDVAPGEVLGFLGPNGAGKSTTMRILTGFLAPTSGRAWVAGEPVDGPTARFRRHLGYLPENAPLHTEMTVREQLRFAWRMRGGRSRARDARIEEVTRRCALGPMLHREIGRLSKGYRQRVGLAQALLGDPDILILDEPTSGLDPNQVQAMRALVREVGTERTVLFSSHVLQEVQAVATRVLIIDAGRIVADDSPDALGRRIGGGRLRVEVAGAEVDAVERLLGGLPEVAEVTCAPSADGVNATVRPAHARDARAAVARAVVGAGWALLSLTPVVADLETVFRHVTQGAPSDSGPS